MFDKHRVWGWGLVVAMALSASQAVAFAPVQEVVTPSGFKVWLVEDHSLPIISVSASFQHAGSAYVEKEKQGLDALAMNMLQQGAGDLNYEAFQGAMDELGMSFNTSTASDDVSWSLQTLSEKRHEAFGLAQKALCAPQLHADSFERLRKEMQTAQDVREQDPKYVAAKQLRAAIYAGHPYGLDDTKESLGAVSLGDVKDYLQQHLTQKQLMVTVVGDISPADVAQEMDALVACLPHGDDIADVPQTTMQASGQTTHVAKDVPQTAVMFALPAVTRNHPDFYAVFVMNHILGGGGLNSRLMKAIREKGEASYYAYSSMHLLKAIGVIRGGFASRREKVEEAKTMLVHELERASKEGFSKEELESAKQYLIGSFPIKLESNSDIAAYVQSMQEQGLGRDFLEKRNDFIRAVTLADVNRVAAQYLTPSHLFIVSVGGK